MEKLTDIREVRKQKRKKTVIRRILLFLVVLALVLTGIYLFNKPDFYDFIFGGLNFWQGEPQFPVPTVGQNVNQLVKTGNRMALLNDTNVIVYDQNGNEKLNFQHKCTSPYIRNAGRFSVIYDRNGKKAAVYRNLKEQYTLTFDNALLDAAVSENGILAVVTGSEEYASEVRVYNSQKLLFTWSSAKNRALSVSVSPNGKNVAVICVNADGGELVSSLLLFDTGKEQEQAKFELRSQLILSAEYRSDSELCAVAENEAFIVKNNKMDASYHYDEKLFAFENNLDGHIALLLGSFTETKSTKLVMLDLKGKVTGSETVAEEVLALHSSGDVLSLQLHGGFAFYDSTAHCLGKCETLEAISYTQFDKTVYYVTNQSLEKAECPAEEKK